MAILKAANAGYVAIQSNSGDNTSCPDREAMLIIKRGTNILNPQAALNPTPTKILNIVSMLITSI